MRELSASPSAARTVGRYPQWDSVHQGMTAASAQREAALQKQATIAKLRSLSSPDQVRALLLKEDAAVRLGHAPAPQEHVAFKPKLDRTLRLRAIRRLQSQKQAELTTAGRRAEESSPSPSLSKAPRATKPAATKATKGAAKPAKPASAKK